MIRFDLMLIPVAVVLHESVNFNKQDYHYVGKFLYIFGIRIARWTVFAKGNWK